MDILSLSNFSKSLVISFAIQKPITKVAIPAIMSISKSMMYFLSLSINSFHYIRFF